MSRVTRCKHVMMEMSNDNFELPADNQQIVRVVSSRGNNLHEVEPSGNEENFLVSMPTKFRRNFWIKRGDFVLVEPIEEGCKVKAEIIRILTPEHVKEFTKSGVWPKKFTNKREIEENEDHYDDDLMVRNVNRRHFEEESTSSSSEESDDN